MIKITPPSKPDIIFPVVRRCVLTKSVWLFLTQNHAVCMDVGYSSWSIGEMIHKFDPNTVGWTPVDLHITG
jgi:hypothetical protein